MRRVFNEKLCGELWDYRMAAGENALRVAKARSGGINTPDVVNLTVKKQIIDVNIVRLPEWKT